MEKDELEKSKIRYCGIRPNFGFLEEPETNGVVERWNRTLKEQAIYGRVFRNLDDVAVAEGFPDGNQAASFRAMARVSPIEWKNVILYGEIKIDPDKLRIRGR